MCGQEDKKNQNEEKTVTLLLGGKRCDKGKMQGQEFILLSIF